MNIYGKIINLFFPSRCPYCDKVILFKELCCQECDNIINIEPLVNNFFTNYKKVICISAFKYENIVSEAIKSFKFGSRKMYAQQFAIVVSNAIEGEFKNIKFDCLTYVPINFKRYLKRGFNQSALITKRMSNILNIPYKKLLFKNKDNIEQHKLSRKNRIRNVEGVYSPINVNYIKRKNILIFDDIMTTGSTLKECCKVLLDNGAKEVYCATIAAVTNY